jgi:hypothetical protein
MCTAAAPASTTEAVRVLHAGLAMVRSAAGFLAASGAGDLPAEVLAEGLRELERADAAGAAVRGVLLAAFGAQNGQVADGQRTVRTWLLHCTGVTRGQAADRAQMLSDAAPVIKITISRARTCLRELPVGICRLPRCR